MTIDASAIDAAGKILAWVIILGPWVMIPSWLLTQGTLGSLARKCGVSKHWLVWIPVVNVWITGSISDRYRYMVKGQVKSRRKVLLVLRFLQIFLCMAAVFCVIGGLEDSAAVLEKGAPERAALLAIYFGVMDGLLWMIPATILKLAEKVLGYMAFHDIFAAFAPNKRVLYLTLSILPVINLVTKPLCLYLCMKKDEGMPPRRHDPVPTLRYDAEPQPWHGDTAAPKEPWNDETVLEKEPWDDPEEM